MPHHNKPDQARQDDPLTDREQEILALLSTGNSLPNIAAQLEITLGTVENREPGQPLAAPAPLTGHGGPR